MGAPGLEPGASALSGQCSNQLSYAPIQPMDFLSRSYGTVKENQQKHVYSFRKRCQVLCILKRNQRKCVLKPHNLGRSSLHRHDIEPTSARWVFPCMCQKMFRSFHHGCLFLCRDGFDGVAKNAFFSESNLYKAQGLPIHADQVDFAPANSIILAKKDKPAIAQKLCGDLFCSMSDKIFLMGKNNQGLCLGRR